MIVLIPDDCLSVYFHTVTCYRSGSFQQLLFLLLRDIDFICKHFLTYETEFVLFLAVMENSLLFMG